MVTRGRSSSSSPSLLDALRVRAFSGHPLLVALIAAQIIKAINKGPVCFAPDYTGVCLERVETTVLSRQGLVDFLDWNKDVACLDKSWAVSGSFGAHFTPVELCPISVRWHCPLSSPTLLYLLLRFRGSSDRFCFPNSACRGPCATL